MEEHRLKQMPDNYNRDLLERLYKDTQLLRNKLVYGIDSRRFGVEKEDIASWFDIKFLFVFTKYYEQFKDKPGVLKGHIINSLKLFKYRVLKEAYMQKNEQYRNKIEIQEVEYFENLISTSDEDNELDYKNSLLEKVHVFLKSRMSDNAYLLFELQLNPPPFILNKLKSLDKQRIGNIPNDLLADYLGFIPNKKTLSYIGDLKREVKVTVELAREYFQSPETEINLFA